MVWNVYPEDREMDVCSLSEKGILHIQILGMADELGGGDVSPDFSLKLAEVFARLPEDD